jgi:hypothetical protein
MGQFAITHHTRRTASSGLTPRLTTLKSYLFRSSSKRLLARCRAAKFSSDGKFQQSRTAKAISRANGYGGQGCEEPFSEKRKVLAESLSALAARSSSSRSGSG